MLRNEYYIGIVNYAGTSYQGRHEPLIDEGVFDKVQQILNAQRQSGERSWIHHSYLRGTLYCAQCGKRLFFTQAKGRGGTYHYFICGGRSQRTCSQPHHRVAAVEAAIERHYATVQLTNDDRDRIRQAVKAHIEDLAAIADKETSRARTEVTRLDAEERKLLAAHYADRISDHIFAEEQQRIRRERIAADQLLQRFQINHHEILDTLDVALELTDNIQQAYLNAEPTERRLLNQALFKRIEIDTEDTTGHELEAPFAQIHALHAAHQAASAATRAARAPRRVAPAGSPQKRRTPEKVGGSYETLLVEENGARLNRDRLASAYLLAGSLAARPDSEAPVLSPIRRRAGLVRQSVIQVLANADRPLRASEVHAAAQELAGEPLSWNTVKDCLHKNARRPGGPIERVSHGRYQYPRDGE